MNERFPVVVFMHGMAADLMVYYSKLLDNLASWGFFVIAPWSCPQNWCINWYLDAIESVNATRGRDGVFSHADFNRVGVMGHAMGGEASLKTAT